MQQCRVYATVSSCGFTDSSHTACRVPYHASSKRSSLDVEQGDGLLPLEAMRRMGRAPILAFGTLHAVHAWKLGALACKIHFPAPTPDGQNARCRSSIRNL